MIVSQGMTPRQKDGRPFTSARAMVAKRRSTRNLPSSRISVSIQVRSLLVAICVLPLSRSLALSIATFMLSMKDRWNRQDDKVCSSLFLAPKILNLSSTVKFKASTIGLQFEGLLKYINF